MSALRKRLSLFLKNIVIVLTGAMIVVVTWQVFSRFVLRNSPSWSEELSRYLFIWISLLAVPLALERKRHLGFDYFVADLKGRNKIIADMVAWGMVALFSLVMIYWGIKVSLLTWPQITPSLRIPRGIIYLPMPLSGLLILFFSVEDLVGLFTRYRSEN